MAVFLDCLSLARVLPHSSSWEEDSEKYLVRCSDDDFVSVFLDLFSDPYVQKIGEWEERKKVLLRMYRHIARKTIGSDILRDIAERSAVHLISAIRDVSLGIRHPAYYGIAYNRLEEGACFETKYSSLKARVQGIDLRSFEQCVAFLSNHRFAMELKENNPISLFLQIWEMSSSVPLEEDIPIVRDALCEAILDLVYPQKGETYQPHLALFPRVMNLFDQVSKFENR